MNKERLLKVLKYARAAVNHPEGHRWTPPLYTDGVKIGFPPSSKSLKAEYDNRLSRIEEYENFIKDVDALIKENE